MEYIISVKNLNKEFLIKKKSGILKTKTKKVNAVSNVSFNIKEKEIVGLLGPNGAGKSTIIKMLTGIIQPSSGEVNLMGLNPAKKRKQISYYIGCVFGQKSQLWFHLPAIDSFKLLGSIYDIDKNKLDERIRYLSRIMEIEEFIDIPVRKLSLGQRMRCEIVASLIHNPKIIFLDEPTIGLDIVSKKNLRSFIKKINEEENITIFITSHDMGDIESLCNRIILINNGVTMMDNSINNIKNSYDSKRIITINYYDEIDLKGISNKLRVINSTNQSIEVEVNCEDVESVIFNIMKIGRVQDIKIKDKSIEDIIEDLYNRKEDI